jgi:hypothetical protein
LFSGGLDSLIGAIDTLETGKTPLLISHSGEGAISKAQTDCFDALKAHYPKSAFNRLRVWMTFSDPTETSTRARSFLFIALGIFAGTGLGRAFTLQVPENGLIALNVPLDPLRLGSHSTRTTHPFYLARWNELLAILGIEGKVENPYWDKTKGEMVSQCASKEALKKIVPKTLSCSSPTKGRWEGHPVQHCGYCLPCLIRRAALDKGLDPTVYTVNDLEAQPLDTMKAEGEQIRSLQFALRRLQMDPRRAAFLVHSAGPLSGESSQRQKDLVSVYERGMEEVARILRNVQTRPE